jgi:hypothetical protein
MERGSRLTRRAFLAIAGSEVVSAQSAAYERARRKIALIENEKAAPGSTIAFTPREINEWARAVVPTYVPQGFRDLRIDLGEDTATGQALIDFARVRHASDADLTVLDKLIAGERPVLVKVTVRSADGICNVDVNRLQISKVAATGYAMDLLIKAFVLPMFPEVKVGEPFQLRHRIERISVKASGVYVRIKRV